MPRGLSSLDGLADWEDRGSNYLGGRWRLWMKDIYELMICSDALTT